MKQNVHLSCINYDIIAFTESWLDDSVTDSELSIPGYSFFRLDRDFQSTNKCRAGGLIIYVKKNYKCNIIKTQNHGIEFLSLLVQIKDHKLCFTLAYAPAYDHNLALYYLINFQNFANAMEEIANNEIDSQSSVATLTCQATIGDTLRVSLPQLVFIQVGEFIRLWISSRISQTNYNLSNY